MSIFNDHIENSDDILLRDYKLVQNEYGECLESKNSRSIYIDIYYAWHLWYLYVQDMCNRHRWSIPPMIFEKPEWDKSLKRHIKLNHIKTHQFHNKIYYDYDDIYFFHHSFERESIVKYCNCNKLDIREFMEMWYYDIFNTNH